MPILDLLFGGYYTLFFPLLWSSFPGALYGEYGRVELYIQKKLPTNHLEDDALICTEAKEVQKSENFVELSCVTTIPETPSIIVLVALYTDKEGDTYFTDSITFNVKK